MGGAHQACVVQHLPGDDGEGCAPGPRFGAAAINLIRYSTSRKYDLGPRSTRSAEADDLPSRAQAYCTNRTNRRRIIGHTRGLPQPGGRGPEGPRTRGQCLHRRTPFKLNPPRCILRHRSSCPASVPAKEEGKKENK
jgi:hypothetical protein